MLCRCASDADVRARRYAVSAHVFSFLAIIVVNPDHLGIGEGVRQHHLVPPVHAVQALRPNSGCQEGLLVTQWNEEASMPTAGASDEPRNGGAVEVIVAGANASLSQHKALLPAARQDASGLQESALIVRNADVIDVGQVVDCARCPQEPFRSIKSFRRQRGLSVAVDISRTHPTKEKGDARELKTGSKSTLVVRLLPAVANWTRTLCAHSGHLQLAMSISALQWFAVTHSVPKPC